MQKPLSPKDVAVWFSPQPWGRVVLAAGLLSLAASAVRAEETAPAEVALTSVEQLAPAAATRALAPAPLANPGWADAGVAVGPVEPASATSAPGPASAGSPAAATAPGLPASPAAATTPVQPDSPAAPAAPAASTAMAAPAATVAPAPAGSDTPTVIDTLIDRLREPAAAAAAAAVWLQRGLASWYGGRFHGRSTASGERFDMHAFSAAHKTLPLRSYARVRNPANGREVVVRVNDRGPFHPRRIIDLSAAAARQLGLTGVGTVEVEHLGDAAPDTLAATVAAAAPGASAQAGPTGQAAQGGLRPQAHPAARPALRGKPVRRHRR